MKVRSHILTPSVARAMAILCAAVFVATAHPAQAGINVWTSHGPGVAFVTALAIDPTTPGTLYAGTDSDGVFKSTDGASSWQAANTGLPDNTYVNALAIDPNMPSTLYVVAGGGVFKSTDAGATWNATSLTAIVLAIDPTTPGTIYAGWGASNIKGSLYGGVFKSTDGGDTWSNTLPNVFVNALAIDLTRTLYAATAYGVFKSTDGASSWQAVNAGLQNNTDVRALAIDPTTPSTLYAAANINGYYYRLAGGVFKSTDAAGNWAAANKGLQTGNTSVTALTIDPTIPSTLYAAGPGGVDKSTDKGDTWNAANSDFYPLAIDPTTTPSTIYAETSDGGVYKSTDGGDTWNAANTGLPDSTYVNALAIDPTTTPGTLYAGANHGVFKSTDGGDTWNAANTGLPDNTSVNTLAIAPNMPSTLYVSLYLGVAGGSHVYRSTDGGDTWNAANPGLPDNTYVNALAIDPSTPGTLYAATAYGVFKSTDGGDTWDTGSVTPARLTPTTTPTPTPTLGTPAPPTPTPTPASAARARRFVSPGSKDSIAMSAVGASSTGLPNDSSVTALAIDPSTPSTLYAATYQGVFKSTDGASSWQAFNAGLSNLIVLALAIEPTMPGTLYAGTDGGGVFAIQQSDSCIGDCDDSGAVRINEIVTLVNIGLDDASPAACPNGVPSGATVDIALIIQAVNNGLGGCGLMEE